MSSGGDAIVTQPKLNITQRSNSREPGFPTDSKMVEWFEQRVEWCIHDGVEHQER